MLLVVLLTLLSACNVAMSEKPLFGERERSSTIMLEDGLWALFDPDCSVSLQKPKAEWPKCAEWLILRDSKVIGGSEMKADERPQDLFIVNGKPPLLQVQTENDTAAAKYAYLVVDPKVRSAAGRETEVEIRRVECGVTKQDGTIGGKVRPYPGFDKDCLTKSVAALRSAAARPLAQDNRPMRWTWVRAEAP